MNKAEATEIVEKGIIADKPDCALIVDSSSEYETFFIFYYQSKKYIESDEFSDMYIGQGSIIVCKESGKIFETGSAYPVEHYIKAFKASGNPLAEPTSQVEVFDWKDGADKVATTKYIKEVSDLGLKESKNVVDMALKRTAKSFSVSSVAEAEEAVRVISGYSFVCRQLWKHQC